MAAVIAFMMGAAVGATTGAMVMAVVSMEGDDHEETDEDSRAEEVGRREKDEWNG